jgi:predicted RNase H-like nuclease (RuvC/YqgF family)
MNPTEADLTDRQVAVLTVVAVGGHPRLTVREVGLVVGRVISIAGGGHRYARQNRRIVKLVQPVIRKLGIRRMLDLEGEHARLDVYTRVTVSDRGLAALALHHARLARDLDLIEEAMSRFTAASRRLRGTVAR